MHFNTAIAAVMELVNGIYDYRADDGAPDEDATLGFAVGTVLRLLFPFVPHVTSELWARTIGSPALEEAGWPQLDDRALVRDSVEIAIQINGRIRARMTVPADVDRDELVRRALADDRVSKELAGRTPKKTVVVPGRLVNVVA
jgi:leucyl-tRNA synthetase